MTNILPTAPTSGYEINVYEDQVKRSMGELARVKEQLKAKREMYKDGLEGDAEYAAIKAEVDEKKRLLSQRKKMLDLTNLSSIKQDIKDLSEDKKEVQLSFSDYLLTFAEATKSNHIEVDGELLTIKKQAKLTKKK